MKPGTYGSVVIHFNDGVVTDISEQTKYNSGAFVSHVEHPVTLVVVKNKRNQKDEKDLKVSPKQDKKPENGEE